MRRASLLGLAATALLALVAPGCGGDSDDHPNENRPPAPIEMTAKVTDQKVTVSPDDVGAGLANITLANLSSDPVQLTFEGPSSFVGDPVLAGNVGRVKLALEEGDYIVGAGQDSAAADEKLTVGPERPSSQNELLLP